MIVVRGRDRERDRLDGLDVAGVVDRAVLDRVGAGGGERPAWRPGCSPPTPARDVSDGAPKAPNGLAWLTWYSLLATPETGSVAVSVSVTRDSVPGVVGAIEPRRLRRGLVDLDGQRLGGLDVAGLVGRAELDRVRARAS